LPKAPRRIAIPVSGLRPCKARSRWAAGARRPGLACVRAILEGDVKTATASLSGHAGRPVRLALRRPDGVTEVTFNLAAYL
jgi:hypothetical protein